MNHHLFISHASEDKDEVARPLARSLVERGLNVWYDEFSLSVGDSLSEMIDRGMADSSFGAVILSPAFLNKPWPRRELRGLTALAIAKEQKTILPIWHRISVDQVLRFSPPLADIRALSTDQGLDVVADELVHVIAPDLMGSAVGRSKRLLNSGEVGASVMIAATVLEDRLKNHALAKLTYKFFRKKPLRGYGLGQLVRTLQTKKYLPAVGHNSEAEWDFIVRIRNVAAHHPNEVSFDDATRFIAQVEYVLSIMGR
jgi:hypothetical protein